MAECVCYTGRALSSCIDQMSGVIALPAGVSRSTTAVRNSMPSCGPMRPSLRNDAGWIVAATPIGRMSSALLGSSLQVSASCFL